MSQRVGIGRWRWENDPEYREMARRRNESLGCWTDPITGQPYAFYLMGPSPKKDAHGRIIPQVDPAHWRALATRGNRQALDACERLGIPWQYTDREFEDWRSDHLAKVLGSAAEVDLPWWG